MYEAQKTEQFKISELSLHDTENDSGRVLKLGFARERLGTSPIPASRISSNILINAQVYLLYAMPTCVLLSCFFVF